MDDTTAPTPAALTVRAFAGLVRAHAAAAAAIRGAVPGSLIGTAINMIVFEPGGVHARPGRDACGTARDPETDNPVTQGTGFSVGAGPQESTS